MIKLIKKLSKKYFNNLLQQPVQKRGLKNQDRMKIDLDSQNKN